MQFVAAIVNLLLKTKVMQRTFEKYSLLILVTRYVQSAITNKRNKRKRNTFQTLADGVVAADKNLCDAATI